MKAITDAAITLLNAAQTQSHFRDFRDSASSSRLVNGTSAKELIGEEAANRSAGIQAILLLFARVRIAIFAADHGVCAESVTRDPTAVIVQMVVNFL